MWRKPDEVIGGDNPYLLRWHLIPRNRWFNIYLHKFLRDDEDRALHDHPWISLSFASAEYLEMIGQKDYNALRRIVRRRAFLPFFRRATHIHRIILFKDKNWRPIPIWTLFFTGPKIREWFFLCPKGPRHWQEFVDERDHGKIGRGCD